MRPELLGSTLNCSRERMSPEYASVCWMSPRLACWAVTGAAGAGVGATAVVADGARPHALISNAPAAALLMSSRLFENQDGRGDIAYAPPLRWVPFREPSGSVVGNMDRSGLARPASSKATYAGLRASSGTSRMPATDNSRM